MRDDGVDAVSPATPPTAACSSRPASTDVSSVLLTTNDDAMNIYLAVYCRRLNPSLRIVSRITHERNVEAIHRAGADFVLSYTTLGVEAVMSLLRGYELVVLGEGVELFSIAVPPSLSGRRLADSGIGSGTGMSVVALDRGGTLVTHADRRDAARERRGAAHARQPRAAPEVRGVVRRVCLNRDSGLSLIANPGIVGSRVSAANTANLETDIPKNHRQTTRPTSCSGWHA